MFLEQARPHFLAKFKATCNNFGQKRHRYSVSKDILDNLNQNTYLVKVKTCPLKKKKVKRVFICLGEKQNETVGLFPTFLFQGITRDT